MSQFENYCSWLGLDFLKGFSNIEFRILIYSTKDLTINSQKTYWRGYLWQDQNGSHIATKKSKNLL